MFRSKKNELIPEVYSPSAGLPSSPSRNGGRAPAPSSAPSYHSQSSYGPPPTTRPSYAQQSHFYPSSQSSYHGGQQPPSASDRYAQQPPRSGAGDRYGARPPAKRFGGGEARDELLSGAPARPAQANYGDRSGQQEQAEGGESDEEVEGVKQQLRFVKQESLASTRNAVRIAREAEETAMATLDRLGDQSDRLTNAQYNIDQANAHNSRASDDAKEIKSLNRSIFRPNLTWNKAGKRDKEDARLLQRHEDEKAEREQVRQQQYDARQRIDATRKGVFRAEEDERIAGGRPKARGTERGRYQFEATGSDDEVEDEIDDNLDQLSGAVKRLNMLAVASGREVEKSTQQALRLTESVDRTDVKIVRTTAQMARIK